MTLTTLDLVQSDVECTGDEASVDPSCALPGQIGELGGLLQVNYQVDVDCDAVGGEVGDVVGSGGLSTLGSAPAALTTATGGVAGVAAGSTMCLSISVVYPSTTSLNAVQAAQSDSVTWRFAFDAVAIE